MNKRESYFMILVFGIGITLQVPANGTEKRWVTLGKYGYEVLNALDPTAKSIQKRNIPSQSRGQETIHMVRMTDDGLTTLSSTLHARMHRCGGFIVHRNEQEARTALKAPPTTRPDIRLPNYQLKSQRRVQQFLPLLQASHITSTIADLSIFPNRFYRSTQGLDAAQWLVRKWTTLANGQRNVTVQTFTHKDSPQPSVILTLQGEAEAANEIVILGAHFDSISLTGSSDETMTAPGADDNASGIASLTEVIRVLLMQNYRPQRTIKFIAYAAEEVGLRGSNEIAQEHSEQNANVVGVLQLDMTNYIKPSANNTLYLVEDHTHQQQNTFLVKLIKHYLPELTVGTTRCGYACSDHASWSRRGYPASFPFETALENLNPYIHTAHDTLDNSDRQGQQALKFSKLALAYAVELGSKTQAHPSH